MRSWLFRVPRHGWRRFSTITGMDPADHALHITHLLPDVADDVLVLALTGAGLMVLARTDPATAEALAGVLEGRVAAEKGVTRRPGLQ